MSDKITLQQALFGYRDGHNLLATSTPLAPHVRQFLATVTDSSGPESNTGFEGSFTGLPVLDTDFYALFSTWSAPEMPRPGCVWSHVILIQLADLARIPDLSRLRRFCVRPSLPIDSARYERPFNFGVKNAEHHPITRSEQKQLRYLIRALYEHHAEGIVIFTEEGGTWENVVFKIWDQQWPRLRRQFAFSTGSLGDRRLAGIPFDLQIAPFGSEHLWRRSGMPTFLRDFLPDSPEPFKEAIPHWVKAAEDDLREASARNFRQFLFDYGSDIENPRAAFGRLAVVYMLVTSDEFAWSDLLHLVGESFPASTEAVRLKRRLMALPEILSPSERLDRVWAIVSFILDSHLRTYYPSIDIDFESCAILLWKEKREDTISLLSRIVQREESTAAISFASSISRTVDSSSLSIIAESHSGLVPLVIRHNHALAYDVDTWKLKGNIQTQVYETLKKILLSQEDWGQVVGAMFIAATYVSVREAVEMAGHYAMLGAFRWLEVPTANELLPTRAWQEALAASAIQLLRQRENLMPAQLALAAWCANSNEVRRVLSARREDVQRLAGESPTTIPAPLRIPTAFLLVTLGLKENSSVSVQLILKNFFAVHEALAHGTHSSESWWLLSPELPELGWWRDWDQCEKLRRAAHCVLKHNGVSNRLYEFATNSEERKIARKVAEG